MNKKILHLITLLSIAPAMTSCSLIDAILNNSSSGGNSSTYVPIDPIVEGDGYYKPSSLAYKATDYDEAFSPSSGNLNILVIPIEFNKTSQTVSYTDSSYEAIRNRYFGEQSDTLKTYYKNASFGKLNISGVIANKYEANLSASTVNDYSDERFNTLLKTVYEWTLNNNPSLDFSIFDSNNDGFIDSVHFITNLSSNAFGGSVRSLNPDGYLWPHMWYVQNAHDKPGTHARPALDVYLCTTYGMIGDTTSIHEQGHVFGVEDYYNYSDNSYADYIGGADMQDLNCFDWNSYSKMLMDWTQPYVVDGKSDSVTITIKPASTSGDCILIPANGSKWNGSAYDEYILLELFTKCGNNALDWDNWPSIAASYGSKGATALGNGGVRMYHVDSRLYGFNDATATGEYYTVKGGGYITNPTTTTYNYVCLPQTNSYNNYDYSPYYVASSKDYKQLSLIQAGKVNTFKTGTSRNALAKSDLFQTGNVFNMNYYSSFFKNGRFNNGDTFPYTITFDSVTSESATITISK
ncbi:MAG: hypothetical protein MJ248_05040 [Bacilli bacterium]|nr:hypothetical protein [Bacilli bacterium]